MIYGLFRLKKYFRLFLFYLVASFGILLLWPDVWVGTRFMLPLVPLLTFLFINGLIGLVNILGFKVLKIKSQTAIYLVLVALSLITIRSYGKKSVQLLEMQARGNFPKPYQNYFEIAEWIKKNAPANSVTCCRKEALFYLYSGKYVTGFANTGNEVKQIKYLKKQGTDYVVLDHLGYSSTARYLYPAIQKFPNKFKVIKHIKNPDTYLFKFEPELGYWGQWKNNKRNGFGTFRWPNGMFFEGMWKDNMRNGRGIIYNPNGQRLEGYWKNDKLNGYYKSYDENGYIMTDIMYKNGEKNGLYKSYYKNENIYIEAIYRDDKLNGKYKKYYKNGNIWIEAIYKDDKLNGEYKLYYENGQIMFDRFYKNDEKNGPCKKYDEDGNLIEYLLYKNDRLIKNYLNSDKNE